MIVVIMKLNGEELVLCHEPGKPSFWQSLETEESLGFSLARRFDTEHGAEQAALLMGGKARTLPDPEPPPALLQPQVG